MDLSLNIDTSHRLYSEDILISPRNSDLVGEEEKAGLTFYTACLHGDLAAVKEIFSKGIPREFASIINYPVNGWMPLDIAIFHKNEAVIEYLYSLSIWHNFRRIKTMGTKDFEFHVSWFWNLINNLQKQKLLSDHNNNVKNTHKNFIVLVTTQNEEKLRPIIYVVKEYLNHDAIVLSMNGDSGIFHGQPWGVQATYEGASTRIENATKALKNRQIPGITHADYIVSIENGVFAILTHERPLGQDSACVIIEKLGPDNEPVKREFAFSISRNYPLDIVYGIKKEGNLSNAEIGEAIKKYYENENYHFSRYEQVKDAALQVLSAFKPTKESVLSAHG